MTGAKTTRRGVRRCNLHHLVKKPIEKNGGNGSSILAGIVPQAIFRAIPKGSKVIVQMV